MVMARPVNYGKRLQQVRAPAREQIDSFFSRIDKSGA
jgi:hypothetical protein